MTSSNFMERQYNEPNRQESGDGCSRRLRNAAKDVCSVKTLKKRVPITSWLPTYSFTLLLQDMIAGVTVGLTAIPQGIAYAIVAELPPQYGLYSSLVGGFIYLVFGSCKDITVGPTAILAVMVSKYVVGYSPDFAVLATFLSGCVILLLGILNLGFLVEFISGPVISGFTTAAAMQIAATQLKAFFGLSGASGYTFVEAVQNFVKNFKTMKLWDPVLGSFTIIGLLVLKYLGKYSSRTDVPGFTAFKNFLWKLNWFISLARNAVVVVIGIVIAYCLKKYMDEEPFALTGTIQGGLPKFSLPPFSTVVGNETYYFPDMLRTFGPQSVVLPLISVLESIAIAKAFAKGKMVDATQEMIALGFCNILSSFGQSMPITGSFTRTAINYASGVQTPAGGVFKGIVVLLALSLLTSTFYYIPRATLAGLIITAMFSMIDYAIFVQLWRNKKIELLVLLITTIACLTLGLEYGIISGIVADAFLLLFRNSRPPVHITTFKAGRHDGILIVPSSSISYCAADHLSRVIQEATLDPRYSAGNPLVIVVDGASVQSMDSTVAKNMAAVISDIERNSHQILFWRWSPSVRALVESLAPNSRTKFVEVPNIQDYIMEVSLEPSEITAG